MTTEQLKAIRPRKDDFYSRRLYSWIKWLSEKRFDRTRCGIKTPLCLTPEAILSRLEIRRCNGTFGGKDEIHLVIPFGDKFYGHSIRGIRRGYRNEGYMHFPEEFGKPLKNFWRDYIKKGVCHLNPKHHWTEGPTAWKNSPNGKTRTCRWCGLKQKLQSKTVKKTETWWEEVKNPLQSTRPKRP